MNRRFLALALAGTLSLSLLAGCGSSKEPAPESSAPVGGVPLRLPGGVPVPRPCPPTARRPSPRPRPPPEETPSQAPSAAPSAKPSAPAATPKPTQKPTSTPTPEPVEPEPQVDAVQSTWNDISKLDIPSLTDLDDATLTALYGIDPADLDSYLCKMPMVNVQATEFFIAKVKDGKMDTVKAAVEKRQDDLEAQWSQYLPEQLELVQNYKLVTNGNYILFAVSEYADEAVTAFNTYTK
ncbi:hypothetical protein HMPREF0995_02834 [Lachnospiraceae bacterium 7_1_58FAA]|nr:hypothetical protein HMPREF0995_02834 [Lachnospiraceae bacterium 7_1_58FAA]